jgi:hypothetical protein
VLIDGLSESVRRSLWQQLRLSHLAGVTVKQLLLHRSKINYGMRELIDRFLYQNPNFDLIGQGFWNRHLFSFGHSSGKNVAAFWN